MTPRQPVSKRKSPAVSVPGRVRSSPATSLPVRVRAFAPASIGNLAVGFDALGLALEPIDGTRLGDEVEVAFDTTTGGRDELVVAGAHAADVPSVPGRNLVMQAKTLFDRALRRAGGRPRCGRLTLFKNLPVCSGLGSSASSAVAALTALNAAYGQALPPDEILGLAGELEGGVSGSVHYDNVAPSLLGGLCLILPPDVPGDRVARSRLPAAWRVVVVHPDLSVPTSLARSVLPSAIPLKSAVLYWQRLAAFIHALATDQEELARRTLEDTLVEPYRRSLVKGFARVKKAALAAGAFACSLSGSGPSLFAVTSSPAPAAAVGRAMQEAFAKLGITSRTYLCRPDGAGASAVEEA